MVVGHRIMVVGHREEASVVIQRAWRLYAERSRCRICLSPGAIAVCGCSAKAHSRCLSDWIASSRRVECEICRTPFAPALVIVVVSGAAPPRGPFPAPTASLWSGRGRVLGSALGLVVAVSVVCLLGIYMVYQLHRVVSPPDG